MSDTDHSMQWWEWLIFGLVIILVLPFVIFIILNDQYQYWIVRQRIRLQWLPQGTYGVLITSDHAVWAQLIKKELQPLLNDKVVVLNWRDRRVWRRQKDNLAARVSRLWNERGGFGNYRHLFPTLILFDKQAKAHLWRLRSACNLAARDDRTKLDKQLAEIRQCLDRFDSQGGQLHNRKQDKEKGV